MNMYNKFLNRLILLAVLPVYTACGGNNKAGLSGKIKNANGQNLIFEKIY